MKKFNIYKKLCALIIIFAMVAGTFVPAATVYAESVPSVSIENSGSRLNAKAENMTVTSYQWQIADTENGNYNNIDGATTAHYDIRAKEGDAEGDYKGDQGKYIRVLINGTATEPVGPIGNLIIFDLSKGSVSLGEDYSGFAPDGAEISGTHVTSNIYVVQQSDVSQYTTNIIKFPGSIPDTPFDVTLDGVHMGSEPVMSNAPNTNGHAKYLEGAIDFQPDSAHGKKHVVLRLKGENIVRAIRYSTKGNGGGSSFKITDINGDKATNGGSLYVPVKKVTAEEINAFVNSNESYNHWNSGIGGDDGSFDRVDNFEIAGGKIQVLTTYADNCTAIGAGGNGYCQMKITGGKVIAHCNGTGAAIGGGIGWNSQGGESDVTITGGTVYAKNHGKIYTKITGYGSDGVTPSSSKIVTENDNYDAVVGGVAIGSGSTFFSIGSEGKVTISGGSVEAYAAHGNAIGGGNSSSKTGGKATITITGGTVVANSIGGGSSLNGAGGAADVIIDGTANVTLNKSSADAADGGIGGGDSSNGEGGKATINVYAGIMNCAGIIGGGNGGVSGNGGAADINVYGGILTAQAIGGGVGGASGHGGAADIYIEGGNISTGSIGGGSTLNPNGSLGYAKALITGGDISGQFLMAKGGTEPCTFEMTGGRLHGVNTLSGNSAYTYEKEDGAAVYMDDPNGIVKILGGVIENCHARNGGAIYMTAGTFEMSQADANVETAIRNCSATGDGGAVYLGGGNVKISGGTLTGNIAANNGGAIAIKNGNFRMIGGAIDGNTATNGSGGGLYVAADGKNLNVDVASGSLSANTSKSHGGAIAVFGQPDGTENISVTVGVNKKHQGVAFCEHGDGVTETGIEDCPVLSGNSTEGSGGAIYVTGGDSTVLNLYCCIENENSLSDAADKQSRFMKVEGGRVVVTASEMKEGLNDDNQDAMHGNVKIQGTVYITGGKVDLWGDMKNPSLKDIITVDIEKTDDYFDDHRKQNGFYKLIYFENFADPVTGDITGQYKEQEVPYGYDETISGNIYYHPGYTIVGWNTDPEGDDDCRTPETSSDAKGWYGVNEKYKFDGNPIGDLTIYAIWEANGYVVKYDPNVGTDEPYEGKMDDQYLTYDVEASLTPNDFTREGYEFLGWNTKADGSGTSYRDGQKVMNLVEDDRVTLYAQWEKCDHNITDHIYTYSVVDDGATLRRDCSCGAYYETAAISAGDTVYDKAAHPASVNYSAEWKPELIYTDKDGNVLTAVPVNAGVYTASVSDGGKTASVTYIIEKAEQKAPPKPTYETTIDKENNISTLVIKPVADSTIIDDSYDSIKEYKLVYYVGDEKVDSGWSDELSYNLNVALTNYYVYARYSEGTNYKASPATMAENVYFFYGDVEVHVNCAETVEYFIDEATEGEGNGIKLHLWTKEGCYFSSDYEIVVSEGSFNKENVSSGSQLTDKTYMFTNIPASTKIYITLPDASKIPSVAASVTEGEIFSDFTGNEATISRDSAYTSCFMINGYDQDAHVGISLTYSQALTPGTTIIMVDKKTGVYYRYVVTGNSDSINLEQFIRMGTTDVRYTLASGDSELQFITDFSGAYGGKQSGAELESTLSLVKKDDDSNVPDASATVKVYLRDAHEFGVTADASGTTAKIIYECIKSTGTASKWDGRNGAIVLKPSAATPLPEDAYIKYSIGTYNFNTYMNPNGYFIIPLTGVESGSVNVTLVSKMLTPGADYDMEASWLISDSIAGSAPMNGELAGRTEFTFTGQSLAVPSIKIASNVDDDDRLYSITDEVDATLTWLSVPLGNDISVTLLRKNEQGVYSGTGWAKNIEFTEMGGEANVKVPLGGADAGSYCLNVTVREGLLKVTETRYYFIVQ